MDSIRDSIRKIAVDRREVQSMLGSVVSVDERAGTCDVQPADGGAKVLDVMLVTEMQDGVLQVPTVDSLVVIDFYDDAHAYVACFGESQRMSVQHDMHMLTHSPEGLSVEHGTTDSLAKAIEELIKLNADTLDLLTRFIVITPAGPSTSVDPATITQLTQLKLTSNAIKAHFKRLLY